MATINYQRRFDALVAAIEHYRRMGWLQLDEDEQAKLDAILPTMEERADELARQADWHERHWHSL